MFRTLPEAYKSHWQDHLPKLVHAYNCTRHEATGFSPFALLFRRSPHVPIDLLFGIGMRQPSKNYPSYVTQCRNAMQEAYRIAASSSSKSASQAKVYSMTGKPTVSHFYLVIEYLPRTLKKADQVRFVLTGNYRVVTRLNDYAPVYTVEPENGNGKQHTLHCTLLLPCDSLPIGNPKDIPLHTS